MPTFEFEIVMHDAEPSAVTDGVDVFDTAGQAVFPPGSASVFRPENLSPRVTVGKIGLLTSRRPDALCRWS
jgi:hypothetical protein